MNMIKGYKVVEITGNCWALVVPGFRCEHVYIVTEHYSEITIIDKWGNDYITFGKDDSFAQIERDAEELPLEILRIILKSYLKRHLR